MAKNKVITVRNLPVTISFENTDDYRKDLQWIPYAADRASRALQELSNAAVEKGTSEMSLKEINEEIEVVRKEKNRRQFDKEFRDRASEKSGALLCEREDGFYIR